MAALLLLTGPLAGSRHEVKGEIFIGRSPACAIALEDSKVSRRHVRLVITGPQALVSDLNSRNGTLINGEKLEGELLLLPGDRLQVGDSTLLFEPSARASLADRQVEGEVHSRPVAELMPVLGPSALLYQAGLALLSATSEAMVLRRAAEELRRTLVADVSAALLGGLEGLMTAAVSGAETVDVPRSVVRTALERQEGSRGKGILCAPLGASSGAPFGLVYAQRAAPFSDEDLRTIASLGRLAGEAVASARSRHERSPAVWLIGASRPYRKKVDAVRRAAAGHESVVFYGEPGSGRAQTARYVHSRSSRALGPLVVVDCRQAAAEVEEALLGRRSAPGEPPQSAALLKADGGSLLLLNVEALSPATARALSRFLLNKTAPARHGGEEPVDIRVMATAQATLAQMQERLELPAELVRALRGVELETLPLRERRSDVPALMEWFWAEGWRSERREPPRVSPEAKRLLSAHSWPGNIEELRQVAARLSLLYSGREVTAGQLPPEIQDSSAQAGHHSLAERIARLEKEAIGEALRQAKGKKIRAATLLGISRPTLDKKIDEYNLVIEKRR